MLRLGSDSDFKLAGDFLRQSYTETMLTSELGVSSIFDFQEREKGKPFRNPLAKLFFGGARLSQEEVAAAIPADALQALFALGALEENGDRYCCPVLVYPIRGVLVVSDRLTAPGGIKEPESVPRDFVYLALTSKTRTFLEMLPDRRCEALLDLGAGSGAAALIASRYAEECWASDISPRSTLFATFNARLNQAGNLHVVEGSLYNPVEGRTFDRIVCHPPYDPTLQGAWTFCDGGYDGETVLRGAIQGLPGVLRKGGQFYAQARGGDRKGRQFEHRIREWLGNAHEEFDIAVIVRDSVAPEEYAFASVMTMSKRMEDFEAYMTRFREIELESLAYCSMLIERKTDASEPLTLRRNIGERGTWAELEWLLNSQRRLPQLQVQDCLPVMSTKMELRVRHGFDKGELRPLEYEVCINAPFSDSIPCPSWVARLIAACDGKHSADQIFEHLRSHESLQRHEFEAALKRLMAVGAVEPGLATNTHE